MMGKASYEVISTHIVDSPLVITYRDTGAGADTRHEPGEYHESLQLTQRHNGIPNDKPYVACHPDRPPTVGFSEGCEQEGTRGV